MTSRPVPDAGRAYRTGTVAIVGRPNVGKSTLLNRLVGSKVSITSSKPQTTRQRITGIVTRADAQIVMVDTPGYQTGYRSTINLAMNRSVAASLHDVNATVWMVEALKCDERDKVVMQLLPREMPVIVAINKIDSVKDKSCLLPFIELLAGLRHYEAIVPISAEKGSQLDALLNTIVPLLPVGVPIYDAEEFTTANERFLAAELVREKAFRYLGNELPYSIAVEIETFKLDGNMRRIRAVVLVDKENHKAMVIGSRGSKLKSIASRAREDMERLFGGKVYLEVWVKVRHGWAESAETLKRLGME